MSTSDSSAATFRASLRSLRFRPLALPSAPVAPLRPASAAEHQTSAHHPVRTPAVFAPAAARPTAFAPLARRPEPGQTTGHRGTHALTSRVRTFFTAIERDHQGVQYPRGRVVFSSLFQPRVVVGTDAGPHGHLLAAQPRGAPPSRKIAVALLAGCDRLASRPKKFSQCLGHEAMLASAASWVSNSEVKLPLPRPAVPRHHMYSWHQSTAWPKGTGF